MNKKWAGKGGIKNKKNCGKHNKNDFPHMGAGKKTTPRLDSHRNSVQNGVVESF